jgi:hypothetical protein
MAERIATALISSTRRTQPCDALRRPTSFGVAPRLTFRMRDRARRRLEEHR